MNNTLSSQDFSRQVRDMREANASVNPLDDEFSRDIGLEDQHSPRSVKTNTNVVILWDMLKVSSNDPFFTKLVSYQYFKYRRSSDPPKRMKSPVSLETSLFRSVKNSATNITTFTRYIWRCRNQKMKRNSSFKNSSIRPQTSLALAAMPSF